MTIQREPVDARRSRGWLPKQGEVESWLEGHRTRVQARGEQITLHPVLKEFRELLDSDPIVRMYVERMIEQVPRTKPYDKRHVESVEQLLQLINELLTMAPEFGST